MLPKLVLKLLPTLVPGVLYNASASACSKILKIAAAISADDVGVSQTLYKSYLAQKTAATPAARFNVALAFLGQGGG